MTLHEDQPPKIEVGIRELHDQLSRYVRQVGDGGEVIVTMRGRRVARLSSVGDDPLADLRARGLVRDPVAPRSRLADAERLSATGSVSDLVTEQRR